MAASQDSGNLGVFCNWWKSQKSGPNLDALALSGLPKGVAGNKGGVPKRSRRGRKSLTHQPIHIKDRISTVLNMDTMDGTSSSTRMPSRSNMRLYQASSKEPELPTNAGTSTYSPMVTLHLVQLQ